MNQPDLNRTPPPTAGGGVLGYSGGADLADRRRRQTLLAVGIVSLAVAALSLIVSGTLAFGMATVASRAWREMARATAAKAIVPRALTPIEIAAVQARLRFTTVAPAMTPVQMGALAGVLANPGQAFVAPPTGPGGVPLSAQSIEAFPTGGGMVRVETFSLAGEGTLVIDAAGTVLEATVRSYAGGTTTTRTAGGPPVTRTVGFPGTAPRSRLAAALVAATGSAVSVALAVLLFVAGVMLIAGQPAGVRAHLWYAVAKLPDAAVVTAGLLWEVFGSASAARLVTRPGPLVFLLGIGLSACVYPIVLLVLLRRRTSA